MTSVDASAVPNSAAVEYRSSGRLDIARASACTTPSGAAALTRRRLGAVSVNRFIITACDVAPMKGGSPAIISYAMEARE